MDPSNEERAEAQRFVDESWSNVVADIAHIIAIPSVKGSPAEGAPFGPGPRAALDSALALARTYGFETHDMDGNCGYADLFPGTKPQIGIIGHLDVVDANAGWHFPAFELTQREGYFIGRGTIDDKAPTMLALHAMRFWKRHFEETGETPPFSVRLIFGCDEESGMGDVAHYLSECEPPDFLFTPDADFPLCYGEKGQFQGWVTSAPLHQERILELSGGSAINAIPGDAEALVWAASLASSVHISVERVTSEDDPRATEPPLPGLSLFRVAAHGEGGHASLPEGKINAIGLLVAYLRENAVGSTDERAWLTLLSPLFAGFDGAALDIACEDPDFKALTCVGGVMETTADGFRQSFDVRFPTTIDSDALSAAFTRWAATASARVDVVSAQEAFLIDVESASVRVLAQAYRQVSDLSATPFTMGGGTYARHFPRAVSFGPMDQRAFTDPPWVGTMHGPDEGISEAALKQAFEIYILAIGGLLRLSPTELLES